MESRTQMARPRPRPRTYSVNTKVCAMATFPCGGTSCQRARAGTPDLWQKRTTGVVTSRQDGNELTLITVFARIIRTFYAAVSVHLCVIENFTRPRPRPRTWKCVLKDPRGQGHVLEDSITAAQSIIIRVGQGGVGLSCSTVLLCTSEHALVGRVVWK